MRQSDTLRQGDEREQDMNVHNTHTHIENRSARSHTCYSDNIFKAYTLCI